MKHAIFFLAFILPISAEDWPQFLGPRRDGTYAGKDLAAQWAADGPKILWKEKVGSGWSGAAIAGGREGLFLYLRKGVILYPIFFLGSFLCHTIIDLYYSVKILKCES